MRVCAAAPFDISRGVPSAGAAANAAASNVRWRPHDLLRLQYLRSFDDEPAWVRDAFARAPYAVVRRALGADGFVAIGVRGAARAQRYGTWAHQDDIVNAVPPESLLQAQPADKRRGLPPFVALAALQRDARAPLGCAFGIVYAGHEVSLSLRCIFYICFWRRMQGLSPRPEERVPRSSP